MTLVTTISIPALADMFKTRLGHDRFWVRANNPTILPSIMWNVVSDYWSDDPRIIDIMIQEQAESFLSPGSHLINGEYPDAFLIQIDDFCGGGLVNLRIYVMSDGDWAWEKYGVDVFTTLLMLPAMENGPSKFVTPQLYKDHAEYPHLWLIRDYLYYRLEHPEIPANLPDWNDPIFHRFGPW